MQRHCRGLKGLGKYNQLHLFSTGVFIENSIFKIDIFSPLLLFLPTDYK